jgi:hypothetical protein
MVIPGFKRVPRNTGEAARARPKEGDGIMYAPIKMAARVSRALANGNPIIALV